MASTSRVDEDLSKDEDASGETTGVILSLRESLQNCRDSVATCQKELLNAKCEIQGWHSTFYFAVPSGSTPDPKVMINQVKVIESFVESLREQLENAQKKEAAFMMSYARQGKEIEDLKTVIHDMKEQLKPSSMQARRFLLNPAVHEEFTRLKNLLEKKDKELKGLQEDITAIRFTPRSRRGRVLMGKCRSLIQENEELGNRISEEKILELTSKLALQKSQNSQLRSQFEGLQKNVEGLTNDVERSSEMVFILRDKLEEKDREIEKLERELEQKTLEDGDLEGAFNKDLAL